MTEPRATPRTTAAALRREFDGGFADARAAEAARAENMIALRLGGVAYAIRVAQIAGLSAARPIVPFPTPVPDLLGLATFHGRLAPVYDLAAALGLPAIETARWLVLPRGTQAVALAFERFEAHLVVPPERVVSAASIGEALGARRHVCGAVQDRDAVRPILDLSSVLGDIEQRAQAAHAAHAQWKRSDVQ